jgi:hypothetical protein
LEGDGQTFGETFGGVVKINLNCSKEEQNWNSAHQILMPRSPSSVRDVLFRMVGVLIA